MRAGGLGQTGDGAVAGLGEMRADLFGHGGEAPAQVKVRAVDEAEFGHCLPFAQVIAHLHSERNANRAGIRTVLRGFVKSDGICRIDKSDSFAQF